MCASEAFINTLVVVGKWRRGMDQLCQSTYTGVLITGTPQYGELHLSQQD